MPQVPHTPLSHPNMTYPLRHSTNIPDTSYQYSLTHLICAPSDTPFDTPYHPPHDPPPPSHTHTLSNTPTNTQPLTPPPRPLPPPGTTPTSVTQGTSLGNGSIFITGYIKSTASVTLPSPTSSLSLYSLSGGGVSGGGVCVYVCVCTNTQVVILL